MESDVKKSMDTEESAVALTKKHSLTQLKLPSKPNTTNFGEKSTTPKTPTPTRTVDRLLKKCDEFGLFEELNHVNLFDESFKKAIENKDSNVPLTTHPMKQLSREEGSGDLNTPQYPSTVKEVSDIDVSSQNEEKSKDIKRSSKLLRIQKASKTFKKILPKPIQCTTSITVASVQTMTGLSTKDKLKAFILKDPLKSPILEQNTLKHVEKECRVPSVRSLKKEVVSQKSYKVPESSRAAAKRYRVKVKIKQQKLEEENRILMQENQRLTKENLELKRQLQKCISAANKTNIIHKIQPTSLTIPKIVISSEGANNNNEEMVKEISQMQPIYILVQEPIHITSDKIVETNSNVDVR